MGNETFYWDGVIGYFKNVCNQNFKIPYKSLNQGCIVRLFFLFEDAISISLPF